MDPAERKVDDRPAGGGAAEAGAKPRRRLRSVKDRVGGGWNFAADENPIGRRVAERVDWWIAFALAAFSQPHWIVLGALAFLPFLSFLAVGRWSLDCTPHFALRFLETAIFAASAVVLSCSKYSPWGLVGFRSELVFSYAMASVCFAYCVLCVHQHALFAFARAGVRPFPGARALGLALRCALFAAVAVFFAFEAAIGRAAADTRTANFLLTYVDAVVDSLGGRDLLVTDFVLEDVVRIRARERGLDVAVVNVADPPLSVGRRLLREKIADPALRNAFDLGILPFFREYVGRDPEARNRLALTYFPDLWNFGPCRAYPRGLCFVGAPADAPPSDPLGEGGEDPVGADVEAWRAVARRLERELAAVPEDASPALLAAARMNFFVQSGDFDAAEKAVSDVLAGAPREPDLLLDLFSVLSLRFASAEEPARSALRRRMEEIAGSLRLDPSVRAFQGAVAGAVLHLFDGKFSEARDEFRIADAARPGVPGIVNQILRLDYALQDRPRAEVHARRLLELTPDHGFANYVMGSLALGAGRIGSAKAFLERSAANWDSPLPRGDLAWALYLEDDFAGAERLSREALALDPGLHEVLDTLGLALLAQARPSEARETLGKAAELAAESVEKGLSPPAFDRPIRLHYARALFDAGSVAAARETLATLDASGPSFAGRDAAFRSELRVALSSAAR